MQKTFAFPVLGRLQCSPPWVNAVFPVLGESHLRESSRVCDGIAEAVDARGPTDNSWEMTDRKQAGENGREKTATSEVERMGYNNPAK